MATAKDVRVAPVAAKDANSFIDRLHYSHSHVRNSQLHLGAFLDGRLEGVMSFGPSFDKGKVVGLVRGTAWNGFLELNRMAFSEALPRNSESRALSVAFRLIRRRYPHIEWIVSFADGQQCGDGTIYRAAGFVLTGYSSGRMWELPDNLAAINGGVRIANEFTTRAGGKLCMYLKEINKGKRVSLARLAERFGGRILDGYNFRYVYFLNPDARARLTVQELPYSTIGAIGGRMYRGKRIINAGEAGDGPVQGNSGSAALTRPLHINADEAGDGGVQPHSDRAALLHPLQRERACSSVEGK